MAGRIRDDDIAVVRERARIDEIVREYVTLKSAGGGSLKGLCPFHDERSPSFHVTPSRGMWYCFGCGEGGDCAGHDGESSCRSERGAEGLGHSISSLSTVSTQRAEFRQPPPPHSNVQMPTPLQQQQQRPSPQQRTSPQPQVALLAAQQAMTAQQTQQQTQHSVFYKSNERFLWIILLSYLHQKDNSPRMILHLLFLFCFS